MNMLRRMSHDQLARVFSAGFEVPNVAIWPKLAKNTARATLLYGQRCREQLTPNRNGYYVNICACE